MASANSFLSLAFSLSRPFSRFGELEPAVLGFPAVEGRLTDPVLTAEVSRLHPALVLLQNRDDLLFVCPLRFIVGPFLKARL